MEYGDYFKKTIKNGMIELPKRSLETFLRNTNYVLTRCVKEGNLIYIETSALITKNLYIYSALPVEKQLSPWYITKIEEKKIKIEKNLLNIAGINKYVTCVHVGNYSLISNYEEFMKARKEFEKKEFDCFYWFLP